MTARSPKKDSEIGVKELGERMGEMMEEFRAVREELRESFKEQGRKMREEIEDLRREFREREKRWKEERKETNKQKKKMEERIRRLEEKMEERKEEKKEEERNGRGEVGEKMRELERRLERKEKEERRRNIVIRGLEVKEGGRRENAEKLLEGIGAKVKAIEVKRIGAGLENKDKDFWEGLKKEDVLVMLETWIGEKGWERIRGRLPKGYEWGVQMAKKKNKKGRAIGGMIMGIRKGLKEKGTAIEVDREGWIAGKVKTDDENWSIIGVYAKKEGMEESVQELGDRMEKKEEGRYTIIGGDFNARTGQEGGRIEEEEGGGLGEGRRSKDKKVDREGRLLVNSLEERGWEIFNGNVRGDEEGEFTFTGGRGGTVIDYIIGKGEVREKIVSMVVGERVDSDHHPLEIVVRRGEEEEGRRGGWKKRSRGVWNEEGAKRFIEKIGEVEEKEEELNKEWEEMETRITEAIKGVEEELGNKKGKVGWWDEECREAKKETRRKLRDWRKKREEASAYKERRKEFKEICKRKKEEENQRWERKVEGARREAEVYTAILAERIREEIEGKRMVPHNQTGFRRGMGTIDNIYVLNYMVNRRLEKKGGKLIACFVDLKAAFDSVDRGILIKAMRERGIREGLVRRTEEMLRETKSRVRGGNELGEVFWTGRRVRQGCPLSPILFNVLLADLEEEMGRVK
ncbi:trichohyalin-like [Temnothorax curvispinosus]|uniref:Trichohyalin-like n=1 Tax=Temnothorax curvispinosus TaxID=300111 RepID=A0A6J1PFS8_9HYME|nr:trichohyalin-like [Temnothorax curvispinosus]